MCRRLLKVSARGTNVVGTTQGPSAIVLQVSRSVLVRQAVSIMVLGFLGLVLDV